MIMSSNTFGLKREIISNKATLGTLINSKGLVIAKTLELPFMDNKQGISCIPFGTYQCKRDNTGKYRFWKILNVPGRRYIEFHNGNFADETDGCILLGQDWAFMSNKKTNQMELSVTSSVRTFKKILELEQELIPDEFLLQIYS